MNNYIRLILTGASADQMKFDQRFQCRQCKNTRQRNQLDVVWEDGVTFLQCHLCKHPELHEDIGQCNYILRHTTRKEKFVESCLKQLTAGKPLTQNQKPILQNIFTHCSKQNLI